MIWSGAFDSSIPLDKIKQSGLDGIEIPAFDAKDVNVAVLKRALSDSDLECTFCSVNPPGKNPISEDEAVRAETLEHWKQVVATAGEAGVQLIAGPTYSPVGHLPGRRRNDDEWKWGVDFHRQLDTALQDAGAEPCDRALEPLRNVFSEHGRRHGALCRRNRQSADRHPLRHFSFEHRREEHPGGIPDVRFKAQARPCL